MVLGWFRLWDEIQWVYINPLGYFIFWGDSSNISLDLNILGTSILAFPKFHGDFRSLALVDDAMPP